VNCVQEIDNARDAIKHGDQSIALNALSRASSETVHLQYSVRALQMKTDIAEGNYIMKTRVFSARGVLEALCDRYPMAQIRQGVGSSVDDIIGDEDALYHLLHNAVRNGVRHGKEAAPIHIEVSAFEDRVLFTVTNLAGRNHKNARNLQVSHGANFLMQPTVADAIDLKSCGIGRGDSDFRGCYDMRNAAVAMEAEASLLFDEATVKFLLLLPSGSLPLPCSSEAPCNSNSMLPAHKHAAWKPSIVAQHQHTSENGQHGTVNFLYVDDSNAARVQALRLAKAIGITPIEEKWTASELAGNAFRNEQSLCIWGRTPSEVSDENFQTIAHQWKNRPSIVILDQNIDFGHTVVFGTEVCRKLRACGFEGVVLIRSGNDSSNDEAMYLECEADGMLSKTAKWKTLQTEVQEWADVAVARHHSMAQDQAEVEAEGEVQDEVVVDLETSMRTEDVSEPACCKTYEASYVDLEEAEAKQPI